MTDLKMNSLAKKPGSGGRPASDSTASASSTEATGCVANLPSSTRRSSFSPELKAAKLAQASTVARP